MSQPKRKAPLAMAMIYGANPELVKDQEIARLKAENERLRKALDAIGPMTIEATQMLIETTKIAADAIKEVQS